MKKSKTSPLVKLKNELEKLAKKCSDIKYRIPCLWFPADKCIDMDSSIQVNPATFFLDHINTIEKHRDPRIDPRRSLNSQLPGGSNGNWIAKESIYNLMVRLTTAYDHDGDGNIGGGSDDPTMNSHGIRETGTFLKSIALLGHIRRLGCTTIHLLPVTAIGKDGNKGLLGSPYAIRNPYKLEPSQADPLVKMSVEEQFQAFIEACHILKIRVITEFVFRTASKDSDWVIEHPDWFYWIDAAIPDRKNGEKDLSIAESSYGNPIFAEKELALIKEKVTRNDFRDLPTPSENYRKFFKLAPAAETVKMDKKGRYIGKGKDVESGKTVDARIPGAFADWPPDDTQPPWGDVTYLKMFNDENPEDPRFNYIAYNTVRMYDTALAQDRLANRELWDKLRDLVPTYQETYGIDGVMVDMGHAVPVSLMRSIVDAARRKDPDFAFLSENFSIEESSVKAGYNAVVGYAWWVEYKREGLLDLLTHVGIRGVPLPFFGAVENHNTPRAIRRAGGEKYARYAFLLNTMLPNSIPFIHSGFELGEKMPVNTGLDFSEKDMESLQGKPLPLFDISGFDWDGKHPMLEFTRRAIELRRLFKEAVLSTDTGSFVFLQTGNPDVFAFLRRGGKKTLMVLLNRDIQNDQSFSCDLRNFIPEGKVKLENLLSSRSLNDSFDLDAGVLSFKIKPGDVFLFGWEEYGEAD